VSRCIACTCPSILHPTPARLEESPSICRSRPGGISVLGFFVETEEPESCRKQLLWHPEQFPSYCLKIIRCRVPTDTYLRVSPVFGSESINRSKCRIIGRIRNVCLEVRSQQQNRRHHASPMCHSGWLNDFPGKSAVRPTMSNQTPRLKSVRACFHIARLEIRA